MHKKAVMWDEISQIREILHTDENSNQVVVERTQDVEPILDYNKAMRNHELTGRHKSEVMNHVARIPLVVVEKWRNEGVIDWFNSTDAERRRVLNDPANAMFRTRASKL
jgi:hypothetical protein